MERLQKILARAGLASRREAEKWIEEGRITVNGAPVRELGFRADASKDRIKVDGKLLRQPVSNRYFLFHKPPGFITSMHDPEGRPDIGLFLESARIKGRLFPVGRLDFNSSGLLLLTNDGELAQRLTHPRYELKKVYRVKLSTCPSEKELAKLKRGIELEDGMTGPARVRVLRRLRKNAWVEVVIYEGRYREIRRMFAALGYFVEKLVRIQVGPLRLESLLPGECRPLLPREIKALKAAVGMKA